MTDKYIQGVVVHLFEELLHPEYTICYNPRKTIRSG
jgi:hypothetical protein